MGENAVNVVNGSTTSAQAKRDSENARRGCAGAPLNVGKRGPDVGAAAIDGATRRCASAEHQARPDCGQEVVPAEAERRQVGRGGDVGAAGHVVEERDLTELVARVEFGERLASR